MRFASDLLTGLGAHAASFGQIRAAHLRHLFAWALLFTILFTIAGAWGIQWMMDAASAAYESAFPPSAVEDSGTWVDRGLAMLRTGGEALVRMLVFVGLWWLKMKLMKYVVIVFLGPLMAWTSEQMEAHLTGEERPFDWGTWGKEFVRGLRSAAILFVWEMALTAVLFGASLLVTLFSGGFGAVLSPVFLVAGFLLGSWFYGASVLDFVWERRGLGARSGLRASAARHGLTLGLGIPFSLWMVLPGVGWFIAPIFAPVTAAAAAVIALHRQSLLQTPSHS